MHAGQTSFAQSSLSELQLLLLLHRCGSAVWSLVAAFKPTQCGKQPAVLCTMSGLIHSCLHALSSAVTERPLQEKQPTGVSNSGKVVSKVLTFQELPPPRIATSCQRRSRLRGCLQSGGTPCQPPTVGAGALEELHLVLTAVAR